MADAFVHDFLQIRPVIVDNALSEIFMAAAPEDADDIALLKIAFDCGNRPAAEEKAADGETAEQPKKKKGFMDKVKEAFEDIDK